MEKNTILKIHSLEDENEESKEREGRQMVRAMVECHFLG